MQTVEGIPKKTPYVPALHTALSQPFRARGFLNHFWYSRLALFAVVILGVNLFNLKINIAHHPGVGTDKFVPTLLGTL